MKLCVTLFVLCVMLSTRETAAEDGSAGLQCFHGLHGTTQTQTCRPPLDRCGNFTLTLAALEFKIQACLPSAACAVVGVSCCDVDLCNDAKHAGSSALLLLLSSALASLFL